MDQLRNFVKELREAAEEMLYRDLLFMPDAGYIRSLDIGALFDDMNDASIGYSFLTDKRNKLDGGSRALLRRLVETDQWGRLFDPGSTACNNRCWERY